MNTNRLFRALGRALPLAAAASGLFGLAVTPIAAQVVLPQHFAKTEGMRSDLGVLTQGPAVRLLQVHDSVPATTIRSIAFRRDGYGNADFAGATLIYDVFLSHAATTSRTASATFDRNHGSDRTRVAQFARASFPATSAGAMPFPFSVKLPFNNGSFRFSGQGSLCVEIVVHSISRPTSLPLDVASDAYANAPLHWKQWGTGCRYRANQPPALLGPGGAPAWQANPPSILLSWASGNLEPDQPAILMLGLRTDAAGGVPLPFELPGTRNALSGPCRVYCDNIVAIPLFVQSNGGFGFSQRFPVIPQYNGFSIFGQAHQRVLRANPLDWVTSNVTQHQLLAPFGFQPLSVVWASPPGPSGVVSRNYGYVIQLD